MSMANIQTCQGLTLILTGVRGLIDFLMVIGLMPHGPHRTAFVIKQLLAIRMRIPVLQ